jgi:hypothetical protein
MHQSALYEIVVGAALDASWSAWFGGMAVEAAVSADGRPATCLRGELPDQPALFGVLLSIRDLNLELIRVEKIRGEWK